MSDLYKGLFSHFYEKEQAKRKKKAKKTKAKKK